MARINLLPWREEKRRDAQKQFVIVLVLVLALAVLAVVAGRLFVGNQIKGQELRNGLLEKEIRRLNREIRKIDELEETRDNLLARKEIIEGLQSQRSMTVMMLDELVKTIPAGVTLANIRQQGTVVTLTGTTQSNARVSAYIQNLGASRLFSNPELQIIQIRSGSASVVEPYNFTILVTLVNPNLAQYDEVS